MDGAVIIMLVALLLLVLFIRWVFKYAKKINKRKQDLYEQFALAKGLKHSTTKYMMASLNTAEGTVAGFPFRITEKMVRSGKNQTLVTQLNFQNSPFDFEFKISKEHGFIKAGKLFGLKDIEFNDAEFDKKFYIKSDQEDKLRRLLGPNLIYELNLLSDDLRGTISNSNGEFCYQPYAGIVTPAHFDSMKKILDFMEKLLRARY